MRSTVALILLLGCQFQPGSLASNDGGGLAEDGSDTDADSTNEDAMVAVRRCTLLLGSDHSCSMRTSDGTIHCAGQNAFGELGRGATSGATNNVMQVGVGSTISADSRSYHACVAKPDGSAQCWGYNDSAQIGDTTYSTRPAPTNVTNLANVVEIAVARSFSCARRTDNTVTCWGANADGQLGDGTFAAKTSPSTTVMGLTQTPVEIRAGSSHACARFADGTAACWGRNAFRQLGDGTTTDRNTAVAAPVTGIKSIAPAGYSTPNEGQGGQTCAVLSAGTVSCWGSNNFGQLGNGTTSTTTTSTPVQVAGLTDAVEISMGRLHACVRHSGGNVSCWGRNTTGQVGDGTLTDRSSPTPVALPRPAVHIAAGGHHSCALLDDDSVRCWGLNGTGQLADTTYMTRSSPVASSLCP